MALPPPPNRGNRVTEASWDYYAALVSKLDCEINAVPRRCHDDTNMLGNPFGDLVGMGRALCLASAYPGPQLIMAGDTGKPKLLPYQVITELRKTAYSMFNISALQGNTVGAFYWNFFPAMYETQLFERLCPSILTEL